MTGLALVHSPLVGPYCWLLTARHLAAAGQPVAVPELRDSAAVDQPFWEQHAAAAARAIDRASLNRAWILVGHSGAGPLLPAIGQGLRQPPRGYIFVDAGLPRHRASRLELMRGESGDWADRVAQHLAAGGRFPEWSDEDLAGIVPDPGRRRELLRGLRPRAMPFFAEPLDAPDGWMQSPCAYLQFSGSYDVPASQARSRGWPVIRLEAGHFHMLVDPAAVAAMLIALAAQLRRPGEPAEQ